MKALLLLVLSLSQVIATSMLQLRSSGSLEILEARQANDCPVCTSVSYTAGNCTTVGCVCNTGVAGQVQDCVNCALAGDPVESSIVAAQNLIDAYARTCNGVPGIPAITRPPGIPAPSTTVGGSSAAVPASSSNRLPTGPITVTTPNTPTPVIQKTVTTADALPTSSDVGGGPLPPVVSGAEKGKQAGFALFGALLAAGLIL